MTVYGYLADLVLDSLGLGWLRSGGMRVRFLQPVYDGDDLSITFEDHIAAAKRLDGTLCATGEILWPESEPPELVQYPEAALPAERPPASATSLAPGSILGTMRTSVSLPPGEPMTPAALLELSNYVLMRNVKLGPWIHAASELRHFSLARNGDELGVRARVADRFERKGNQFVVLDILVVADGVRLIQQVRHTAIYEPRLRFAGG